MKYFFSLLLSIFPLYFKRTHSLQEDLLPIENQTLILDLTFSTLSENFSTSTLNTESFENEDIVTNDGNCTYLLEKFSENSVNLTKCIVQYAKPVRICEKCISEFKGINNTYKILSSESFGCHFLDNDQLGVINIMFNNYVALWDKSFCQNCLDHPNETVTFFNASEKLDACLESSNKSSGLNDSCILCKSLYNHLNDIYNGILDEKEKTGDEGICMDIVDKMNKTRLSWTAGHNCVNYDSYIGYGNVLTAVLVGTMPLFFYLLAKHVSIIEDVKIVRPKRKSFVSVPAE